MILRSSPASPFGRKVKIGAALCGIALEIAWADTNDPAESLRMQNPLGKIPVLLLPDGTAIYDSPVILEYFDAVAGGGRILPASGEPRFRALTLQALADGIMDAALLQVYERRFRPEEQQNAAWVANQAGKVDRGLAALEADAQQSGPASATRIAGTPDVGQIGLAAALGYLDLRFAGTWRAGHPALVAWLDGFAAAVPAFAQTRPPG
ncbi:MAG TPA: glutathione S-transferase family protein [Xanthobacteraceae bacterium]|nr:glutathione S-transferase family protein [Xanthobacteraceae bacterium]